MLLYCAQFDWFLPHHSVPGKRELPVVARAAGRVTGKVVTLLNSARDQFNEFTKDSQLAEVRRGTAAAAMFPFVEKVQPFS